MDDMTNAVPLDADSPVGRTLTAEEADFLLSYLSGKVEQPTKDQESANRPQQSTKTA